MKKLFIIEDVHEDDPRYSDKEKYIGLVAATDPYELVDYDDGFSSGWLACDAKYLINNDSGQFGIYVYKFKLKALQ